ncbi:hypothetical protein [Nitrospira sp. Nam80]
MRHCAATNLRRAGIDTTRLIFFYLAP